MNDGFRLIPIHLDVKVNANPSPNTNVGWFKIATAIFLNIKLLRGMVTCNPSGDAIVVMMIRKRCKLLTFRDEPGRFSVAESFF